MPPAGVQEVPTSICMGFLLEQGRRGGNVEKGADEELMYRSLLLVLVRTLSPTRLSILMAMEMYASNVPDGSNTANASWIGSCSASENWVVSGGSGQPVFPVSAQNRIENSAMVSLPWCSWTRHQAAMWGETPWSKTDSIWPQRVGGI